MTAWLRRRGSAVHYQRVGRRRRQMGLEALDPKPRLSQPAAGHGIDPYLWRGIPVNRVNQVWSADRPDVRLAGGCVSRVAVIDWCSRYGLSWAVSSTRDVACGVEALEQALRHGQPEIFKTAQGAQVTSLALTERLTTGRHASPPGWPQAGPGPGLRGALVAECQR
jgi:putative transposase